MKLGIGVIAPGEFKNQWSAWDMDREGHIYQDLQLALPWNIPESTWEDHCIFLQPFFKCWSNVLLTPESSLNNNFFQYFFSIIPKNIYKSFII